MANTIVQIAAESGLTLTLSLFPITTDTAAASGKTLTEATNRKGIYTATVSEAVTDWNLAIALDGTRPAAMGVVYMLDDTAVHVVVGNSRADLYAVAGSAAAASRLALSAAQIIPGTVSDAGFTPTTIEFEAADITEATADHYNGRVIIFTSGALLAQATAINDYSLSTGRGHFLVVALTEAPASGDTFIIV